AAEEPIPTISVRDLKRKLDAKEKFVLVDVRENFEYDIARIPGAKLIPLGELPSRMSELDSADEIVLHCKSGVRSAKALKLLREAGFAKLANVEGGITAWADEVDPSVPKYKPPHGGREMQTIVIGHKNPDMDSICAAIGYARLKTLSGVPDVIAA